MVVPSNGLFTREHPIKVNIKMDDDWGYTPVLGNLHIFMMFFSVEKTEVSELFCWGPVMKHRGKLCSRNAKGHEKRCHVFGFQNTSCFFVFGRTALENAKVGTCWENPKWKIKDQHDV